MIRSKQWPKRYPKSLMTSPYEDYTNPTSSLKRPDSEARGSKPCKCGRTISSTKRSCLACSKVPR